MTDLDQNLQRKLANVRTAYRLLHAYHRRLFDALIQVRDAVSNKHGELPAAWWKPNYFSRVPVGGKDPLSNWVFDFMPLEYAYFSWATAATPTAGAIWFAVHHEGDSGMDDEKCEGEPDVAEFAAVGESETTLTVYAKTIQGRVTLGSWDELDGPIEAAGGGDDDWHDGTAHTVKVGRETLAYGGFITDVSAIGSESALRANLVQPLLTLIDDLVVGAAS